MAVWVRARVGSDSALQKTWPTLRLDHTAGFALREHQLFRRKLRKELDELSGRTTGRLGYVRPNSAYVIGGAAELAVRYV
jgi:hypothetical protein